MDAVVVFESHILKTSSCWLWRGYKNIQGYGKCTFKGKSEFAHRVAYRIYSGPIPYGLTIDHLCRIKSCVNPAHLEAVTLKENILRAGGIGAWNAAKTHCKRGHEFTPENTMKYNGRRDCRECNRIKKQKQNWERTLLRTFRKLESNFQ